jgi:hypothetical protein
MERLMTTRTEAQLEHAAKGQSLECRYGKIGIPAVAAALPYQSDAKNLAYAPAVPGDDARWLRAAA